MRVLATVLAFTAPLLAQDQALGKRMQAVLQGEPWRGAHAGFLVVDLDTGAVLAEQAADQRFAPASVTKLFSCSAALLKLGKEHRFTTRLHAFPGVGDDGAVTTLVLLGSGDPNLSGRLRQDGTLAFADSDHCYAGLSETAAISGADELEGIDALATQAFASGVRQVRDVVVDDRLFDVSRGTPGESQLSPVMVNDNLIDIEVVPGEKAGLPGGARVMPLCSRITVDVRIQTVAAGAATEVTVDRVGADRYAVRGRIAEGRAPLLRTIGVDDAASFARSLLIDRLRKRGIAVAASALADNPRELLPAAAEYAGAKVVAERRSPEFAEALKVILKTSQNLHAGLLPMLLAVQEGKRTLNEGLAAEGRLLAGIGVPLEQITLNSGSGRGTADFVTPRVTVALLRAMASQPGFAAFRMALPVLGVDGTLAGVVAKDSPAYGKVQAKTGSLYWPSPLNGRMLLHSKALAGYLEAKDRRIAFAFFLNDAVIDGPQGTAAAGRMLGQLCELVVAGL